MVALRGGFVGVPGCAGVGFGAVWAGVFLPVQAVGIAKNRGRRVLLRPRSVQ